MKNFIQGMYQKKHFARRLISVILAVIVMGFALSWLVLVNSIGGFTLLFVLIRHGAASAVASLFFLMPPVTAVFGLAWFGESLTPAKVAGFALSAFGVWLATRAVSAMPARR